MKCRCVVAVIFLCVLFLPLGSVSGDSINSTELCYFSLAEGESLSFQDTANNVTVTLFVQEGILTGFGNVTVTAVGGSVKIAQNSSATLALTSSQNTTYLYVDGWDYEGPFVVEGEFIVSWQFVAADFLEVSYGLVVALLTGTVAVIIVLLLKKKA